MIPEKVEPKVVQISTAWFSIQYLKCRLSADFVRSGRPMRATSFCFRANQKDISLRGSRRLGWVLKQMPEAAKRGISKYFMGCMGLVMLIGRSLNVSNNWESSPVSSIFVS
jgi:hypothetical protein